MDVQFSGAVDFAPLLNQINHSGPALAWRAGQQAPALGQTKTYQQAWQDQRDILLNLDQVNTTVANLSVLTGHSINIYA